MSSTGINSSNLHQLMQRTMDEDEDDELLLEMVMTVLSAAEAITIESVPLMANIIHAV